MKVKLATQLFSNSVSDALDFCRTELKMKKIEDSIGIIPSAKPGCKKAMCPSNIGLITGLFKSTTNYLKTLSLPSGELLINSRRKTGFIAMLININSALGLYRYLVEDAKYFEIHPAL